MNFYLYLIIFIIISQSIMIVASRSLIVSILLLISNFFHTALIFLLIGAEFLAIALIIVYVGAIAVIIIITVMVMNLRLAVISANYVPYKPLILVVALYIIVFFFFIYHPKWLFEIYLYDPHVSWSVSVWEESNINRLGFVLYNHYYYLVVICGVILLQALIGSISMTIDNYSHCNERHIAERINNFCSYRAKHTLSFVKYQNKDRKNYYKKKSLCKVDDLF